MGACFIHISSRCRNLVPMAGKTKGLPQMPFQNMFDKGQSCGPFTLSSSICVND